VIAISKKQRGKSGPALVPNTTKLVKKAQMSLVFALHTQITMCKSGRVLTPTPKEWEGSYAYS